MGPSVLRSDCGITGGKTGSAAGSGAGAGVETGSVDIAGAVDSEAGSAADSAEISGLAFNSVSTVAVSAAL